MSLPADPAAAVVLAVAAVGAATIVQAVTPPRCQMGPLGCGYCLSVWLGIGAGVLANMAGYPPITSASIPCLSAVAALLLIRIMPSAFSDAHASESD